MKIKQKCYKQQRMEKTDVNEGMKKKKKKKEIKKKKKS